jgi:hypothetical protein
MEIVVNHLTRMRTQERICVAGVDVDRGRHVRPTTSRSDLLTRELLSENGGPLEVAAVVDIAGAAHAPNPPETEDHRVRARDLRSVRVLDGDDYLEVLSNIADDDLENAFGSPLQRREWKYAIDASEGERSLAVVRARRRPELEVGRYGKLQLRFNDPDRPAFLSVADVRFVEADHTTIRTGVVDDVQARLRRGVAAYVMFGLARAFRAIGDDQERHWLQVNGLCLEDKPVGDTP